MKSLPRAICSDESQGRVAYALLISSSLFFEQDFRAGGVLGVRSRADIASFHPAACRLPEKTVVYYTVLKWAMLWVKMGGETMRCSFEVH
jgi:hypothetical protein